MSAPDDPLEDYLALRRQADNALLATLGENRQPEASYAPLVWLDASCYLFLSELASHTRNLKRDPSLGLLLIEPEAGVRNPFARRRISLQGRAETVARDHDRFAPALAEFRRRFGKVMDMIEPLPDFHLVRIELLAGRFIRGFGQAYELAGEGFTELRHIDPSA